MKNDNFDWMTSEAKTVDLRSNPIAKRYWGMKGAPHCFFRILPSYDAFGDHRACWRKNRYFLKI